MKRLLPYVIGLLVGIACCCQPARGQFRNEAFSQNYNNDTETADNGQRDSSFTFSVAEYIGGLRHDSRLGNTFVGSIVAIGGQQIYNRDYWKLPIIYGGIGAGVGMGIHYNKIYRQSVADGTPDASAKRMRTLMYAGAGAFYWASLLDGVACYDTDDPHHPSRAMIYSLLLPGLGQCYNGEYWKIPIYWGALLGAYHYYDHNNMNYKRFKNIYIEASDPESGYTGKISAETALYYRNMYREYRDYSILAIAIFYLLQAIDANVFAYMQDFEVSEDLSMEIRPALITPNTQFALNPTGVGLSIGLKF